jgi:hypothetical protein
MSLLIYGIAGLRAENAAPSLAPGLRPLELFPAICTGVDGSSIEPFAHRDNPAIAAAEGLLLPLAIADIDPCLTTTSGANTGQVSADWFEEQDSETQRA